MQEKFQGKFKKCFVEISEKFRKVFRETRGKLKKKVGEILKDTRWISGKTNIKNILVILRVKWTNFGKVIRNFVKFESGFCEDFVNIFKKFQKKLDAIFPKIWIKFRNNLIKYQILYNV